MAMACLALRAPCLPSRICSISSRTNSPAWVEADLPSARSLATLCLVLALGMTPRVATTLPALGAWFAPFPDMTLTLTGLLIMLVVAGICGAIGRAIGGGTGGGFIVSIAVGFVGALLGTFLAAQLHLPELLMISIEGRAFPVLWSIIGASLFVALVHLVSGPRRRLRYD